MLLKGKVAVIYGAAGAVGSTIARAFADEGAKVYLTGQTLSKVERVAMEISATGAFAEAAKVDALDLDEVEWHLRGIVTLMGSIDISFNAIGIPQDTVQGTGIALLPVDTFMRPLEVYARSQFITTRAAARHMSRGSGGVILMHTPEVSRFGIPNVGGMAPAWAAIESLSRNLSAEFAPSGVRSIVLRSSGLPETGTIDQAYGVHAKALSITKEAFRAMLEERSHTKRQSTLKELQGAAVFAASNMASGMTGATINITGGLITDW